MSKDSPLAVYAIIGMLGIVAIVAVVGLVILFENNKAAAMTVLDDLGNAISLTAAGVQSGQENCLSLVERPCYMRGAKAPLFWVQVGETGSENSYTKCLLNHGFVGEALVSTKLCGEVKQEKIHFCYQGRGFPLYYLNGECIVPPWLNTSS